MTKCDNKNRTFYKQNYLQYKFTKFVYTSNERAWRIQRMFIDLYGRGHRRGTSMIAFSGYSHGKRWLQICGSRRSPAADSGAAP